MKKLKNYLITLLLPLMFGLFPLFFLYAQNAEEMMIQDLIIPLLQVVGFALIVTIVLGFILKNFFKSALITTMLLFSYFSSGHIVRILPDFHFILGNFTFQTGYLLFILWLAVIIPVIVLIIRTKRNLKTVINIFTTIGAFLLFIQVFQAGFILITRRNILMAEEVSTPIISKKKNLPDVYYIVLDAYGRSDVLSEIYGYDNSYFIAFLKEKGFYVPDKSYSHYCQTILSLGSVLNMNYIDTFGNFDRSSKDRMPVSSRLRDNLVMKYFKGAGYSIAAFASGYSHTEIRDADIFFKPSGTMSEFENVLLTTTMLPFTQTEEKSLFEKHRKRVTYTFNKIPRVLEVESPGFVFAHIISPHPPFLFDENGQPAQQGTFFHFGDGSHYMNSSRESLKNYLKGYKGQITYITKLIMVMIDKIFEKYTDTKPVIILQADHGPGSGLKWESLKKTNIKERFSILNAYYLPGYEGNQLYNNISPINLFRVIFNTYLGTRFERLPHKSYFTRWSRPFDFYDVTDQLLDKNEIE